MREDWQQQRNDIREDWQNHRDQAREDWQDYFEDHYPWHGGWYGGYGSGYWARWDYLWDNYPVAAAIGLTWRAANAVGSLFGCGGDYSNPYYGESMPECYTEPIIPAEPEMAADPSKPPDVPEEALNNFDKARAAFFEGKYDEALKLTDAALTKLPRDAVLHEFRSLALFALKRFKESAATIHSVLDVSPGWDWNTLSSLYPDIEIYTGQIRVLEMARDKDPMTAEYPFLLGYHYLTCGHEEPALKMFQRAAELLPNDAVAASLAAQLSPRDASAQAPAGPAPKPVPPDGLVGEWTAEGTGSSYSMTLRKDGTFSWTFSRGKRKQEAKGVYSVEGNVLAMEPDRGGVMLAELTVKDQDNLQFKMVGGAKDDKGLLFRHTQAQ